MDPYNSSDFLGNPTLHLVIPSNSCPPDGLPKATNPTTLEPSEDVIVVNNRTEADVLILDAEMVEIGDRLASGKNVLQACDEAMAVEGQQTSDVADGSNTSGAGLTAKEIHIRPSFCDMVGGSRFSILHSFEEGDEHQHASTLSSSATRGGTETPKSHSMVGSQSPMGPRVHSPNVTKVATMNHNKSDQLSVARESTSTH
ncbi:hypothetical protein V6N12_020042 [Hibiscus sabdariffa]|uniref:Uncharacterized protein n=1 Tax=Hibiscus sabdariffa TaxID=183260 RepID=A0ABR2B6C7_9ROSI